MKPVLSFRSLSIEMVVHRRHLVQRDIGFGCWRKAATGIVSLAQGGAHSDRSGHECQMNESSTFRECHRLHSAMVVK